MTKVPMHVLTLSYLNHIGCRYRLLNAQVPAEEQDIELLPVAYEMASKGIAKGNPALSATK